MSDLPFSDACERNRQPILKALEQVLPERGTVLEIGSCTGQHVVFFAAALPTLNWQPTDQAEYLPGLAARIREQGGPNILEAIELDVTRNWPAAEFDAVFSANTAHIMNWDAVCSMFAGVGASLAPNGPFCLYGPFNERGDFTSESNRVFDRGLRARDPEMGIRELEELEKQALRHHMKLVRQFRLPANNSLLVFQKAGG
jgi:cyclopropane fatty-acyl-phospholipid synthase-like methyltransferase